MTKSSIFLITLLSLIALFFGYNYYYQPFNRETGVIQSSPTPNPTVTEAEIDPIDEFLQGLTEEELISQMLAVSIDLDNVDPEVLYEYKLWLEENQPGFVTIFGTDVSMEQVKALKDVYPEETTVPIWTATDHEGGTVQRLSGEGFSELKSWQELCAMPSTQSASVIEASAIELQSVGIDVIFSPVVDLAKNNLVLKSRICSDEPEVVVDQAKAWIKSFKNVGILPVLKHFPGIGDTKKDLHTQFETVQVDNAQASVYRSLLSLYPDLGVMVTHVGVVNQFADIPCSLSEDCVGEITDNFDQALIFSDALDMKSASYNPAGKDFPLADVVMEAVEAGDQVLVFGHGVRLEQFDEIKTIMRNRFQSDQYFQSRVYMAVRNIIKHKVDLQ